MALPSNLVPGLLPTEVEFIATSSVEIDVVPLMRIDKVRLLSGVYGPLIPPKRARIPLWLALNLKKRKRCTIVCPDWLQIDNLKKLHREEVVAEAFAPIDLHYIAIAKVLLESAPEDIPHRDEVRAYLKSLREARQSKILSGLSNVNSEHLNMSNISLGEITELRDFLSTAHRDLRAIERAAETEDTTTTQTQTESGQFSYSLRGADGDDSVFGDPSYSHSRGAAPPTSSNNIQQQGIDESQSGEESLNNNNMDLF